MKALPMWTRIGLGACVMLLLAACGPTLIPNRTTAHKILDPVRTRILVRNPEDGRFYPVEVTIPAGWWVADPALIEQ